MPRALHILPAWRAERVSSGLCLVPETLDHVAALASAFSTEPSGAIFSGLEITPFNVRQKLHRPARVIAFATHGLTSEEALHQYGIHEPALLLSRPPGAEPGGELL